MSKILDEYGYRLMVPREDMDAIILVDNQINPNKKMRNKSLHRKVEIEYKRRIIVNIIAAVKKSNKKRININKILKITKKYNLKNKKIDIFTILSKKSIKYLKNLQIKVLHDSRTKTKKIPKYIRTKKKTRRRLRKK
jgi:hypothetical protein